MEQDKVASPQEWLQLNKHNLSPYRQLLEEKRNDIFVAWLQSGDKDNGLNAKARLLTELINELA
jgi:succinate dehydrogenase flavin-adding protein (antitoxin of CptAB toxin-antitoxin module)